MFHQICKNRFKLGKQVSYRGTVDHHPASVGQKFGPFPLNVKANAFLSSHAAPNEMQVAPLDRIPSS
jgi:hypothetical protein